MTKVLKENEEVDCPICKQKHIMTFYNSVNVQHSPELKEKVFNREINALPCSKGVPLGPFLYVDGNKWIWLYPGFMENQKEKIEAEIKQQEISSKKFFGKSRNKIHYVFGYDHFFDLLKTLDDESVK